MVTNLVCVKKKFGKNELLSNQNGKVDIREYLGF